MLKWTKPYFGVQHTPTDSFGRYCTVQAGPGGATLSLWLKGCGFRAPELHFNTAEDARAAAEAWMAFEVLPL